MAAVTYIAMAILASDACTAPENATLTDADRRAIQALDSSFVAAWLKDDTAGVMATLSADAVLMPSGRHPLIGHESIRAYWWPDDGSHTRIDAFVSRIEEVGGMNGMAFIRGDDSLTFTYSKGASGFTQSSRTVTLSVVARLPDGRWEFTRRMWSPVRSP